MADSIVIVPSTASQDFDFLAFSFNGLHSWDDFKIYRVSDGDRYNTELAPQINDLTAENPSADGIFFFGSHHKQKVFNINFAFEEIDDTTIRSLKKWLNGKEQGDLWFEEEPYKVYTAKVTGTPTLKFIPFDKLENGTTKRIYRGEGSVQFTAFWPYAHTPDKIYTRTTDINGFTKAGSEIGNGKDFDSYDSFRNKEEWRIASGLISSTNTCLGENPGDLPAPFVAVGQCNGPYRLYIGDYWIEGIGNNEELTWDGKTGVVYVTESKRAVPIEGVPCGGIPVDGTTKLEIYFKDATDEWFLAYKVEDGRWILKAENQGLYEEPILTIKYHYWYY